MGGKCVAKSSPTIKGGLKQLKRDVSQAFKRPFKGSLHFKNLTLAEVETKGSDLNTLRKIINVMVQPNMIEYSLCTV